MSLDIFFGTKSFFMSEIPDHFSFFNGIHFNYSLNESIPSGISHNTFFYKVLSFYSEKFTYVLRFQD